MQELRKAIATIIISLIISSVSYGVWASGELKVVQAELKSIKADYIRALERIEYRLNSIDDKIYKLNKEIK